MKNVSLRVLMLLLGVMAFSIVFTACDDDEVDPCIEITQKATAKVKLVAEKYEKDQTAENCKAYKKAIEEYLVETKDCSNANREKYNEVLKNLDCEEIEMKENIVGKWEVEKGVLNGEVIYPEFDCPTKKDYVEFFANGKIKSVTYNENCEEEIDADVVTSWTLSGKTLTIEEKENNDIYLTIYTVKTLTAKSMVWVFEKEMKNGKEEPKEEEFEGYLKKIK